MQQTLHHLTGDLNILLASHEHQDITRWKRKMYLQYLLDRTVDIVFTGRFGMENLHRECTARDGESGRIPVERRELDTNVNGMMHQKHQKLYLVSVHSGRGDNKF